MFRIIRPCINSTCALIGGLALSSCSDEVIYTDLRIYSSPYAEVDWEGGEQLKAQHHDHVGINLARILSYDSAGYDAVSLMDYSGKPSQAGAWQQRIWPPEGWLPATVLASFESIEFFIPNAEEVGISQHGSSPFLTSYIEGVEASPHALNPDWQYSTVPEMFRLIRENDGFPCIAHPWDYDYSSFQGSYCVEIFTAFAEAKRLEGDPDFTARDRNANLLSNWDRALQNNQQAYGIAVNDHFGPYRTDVPPTAVDSGKIVVLARSPTIAAYREAFENGAFFAVRETGLLKDTYPNVSGIVVEEEGIRIETNGRVRWISTGFTIVTGTELKYTDLPPNARYLRAEISDPTGDAVIYTQAFTIRPVGDIDGNYRIDSTDDEICASLEMTQAPVPSSLSISTNGNIIAACEARNNPQ